MVALGAPRPWLLDRRLEMHVLRPGTGEGMQLALPEHRHGWKCACAHVCARGMYKHAHVAPGTPERTATT